MFCTYCGNQLEQGDRFCSRCGAPTQTVAASVYDPDPISIEFPTETLWEDPAMQGYLRQVEQRMGQPNWVPQLNAYAFYDEEFRVKWAATKMKRFSFVTCMESVDLPQVRAYSAACMDFALKNYPGLSRGMQSGVASFAVIVSRNISPLAIQEVMNTPPSHFAAFEVPVLVDLGLGRIYHINKTPVWGALLWKDMRTYADMKFMPMR